jgi:general secretion pathway protein K
MPIRSNVGRAFLPAAGLPPGDGRLKGRPHKNRGGALLTVLWLSAALGAISFALASTVRSEIERSSTQSDGLRAFYLATGSVERGIQWMLWGPDYRNGDGTPKFWEPNLSRMIMRYPSGDAIVEMIPEQSKMNINSASGDDLNRLLTAITNDPGRAQLITAAILDWRGGAPGSDFDQFYASIAPTFRARHASFQEIEELLLVRGMTPEMFYGNYVADGQGNLYAAGGLRDCLSVWGSPGPYDANTVSPALMLALGISPTSVDAVVARRRVRPFRSAGELADLGVANPRLGVGGNVIWTLRATARLRDAAGIPSDTVRTAAATVKLVDRRTYLTPVHVLRWYDDAWSLSALAPPGLRVQP